MSRTKEFERTEVLEKALGAFLEKGYAATSIADLVEAVGINRQSLYNEFGDKRQLYLKALESYCFMMREDASEILKNPQPARLVLEKYKNHIREKVSSPEIHKGCLVVSSIMGSANADPDVKAVVDNMVQEKLRLVTEVIERGQKAGELLAKHSPAALAQGLFASMTGISVMARSGAPVEVMQQVLDVAFEGLV
jgi:AcrR family transcriptional regulator